MHFWRLLKEIPRLFSDKSGSQTAAETPQQQHDIHQLASVQKSSLIESSIMRSFNRPSRMAL